MAPRCRLTPPAALGRVASGARALAAARCAADSLQPRAQVDWEEQRAKGGIMDASAPPKVVRPAGPLKFRVDDDSVPEGEDRPMRLNSLTTAEWRAK